MSNEHEVLINVVELASELADASLISNWSDSIQIFQDEEAEVLEYTEEAQDIFNELYDNFYNVILNCKV
jgi:hypothetical protein